MRGAMAKPTAMTPATKRIASTSFFGDTLLDLVLHLRIVSIPQGYNKFLVPPAVKGKSKVEVSVSIILINILAIDIVSGIFRTRFIIDRQWFDPPLSYRNLDKDYRVNLISPEEEEKTWFPSVIFENELSEDDTVWFKLNTEYSLIRNPENKYDPVGVGEIDNAYMYSGDINKHFMRREFAVEWMCEYDMKWYPFDTQECFMQNKIVNKFSDFAALVVGNLSYIGPEDLTEYTVKSYIMCDADYNGFHGVEVRVTLGRPLIGNILIVFIPCIILLIICHLANMFERDFLDMVIGVNLTALLVLGTL